MCKKTTALQETENERRRKRRVLKTKEGYSADWNSAGGASEGEDDGDAADVNETGYEEVCQRDGMESTREGLTLAVVTAAHRRRGAARDTH